MEKSARDSNKKVKTEAEKQQSHAQRAFTTTKTKLEEEVTTLKKQLQDTVAENKAQEQEMMKVSTTQHCAICSSLLYECTLTVNRKRPRGRMKWITG